MKNKDFLNKHLDEKYDDIISYLKEDDSYFRVFEASFDREGRLRPEHNNNRLAAFNIESINGYHPAKLSIYESFNSIPLLNRLKMFNVKYLILSNEVNLPMLKLVKTGSYFSNLSFSNGYKTKDDIRQDYSFSQQSGLSSIESYFDNNISSYNTNLGLNISTGLSVKDLHKIRYEYLYSHTSSDKARFSNGYADNLDSAFFVKESYLEKTIANNNFSGTHIFPNFYNLHNTLIWSYSDGKSDN